MEVATRAAASAVAVNVTGVVMPVAVAVTVFVPAVEPSVRVEDARPLAFVVTEDADNDASSCRDRKRHGYTR